MNNKGQALVEFILILPAFIMILFIIIDFAMIFNKKSNLESISNDAILIYKENESLVEIQNLYKDIQIELINVNDYTKLVFKDKVNIVTPGMNMVFGNPYVITVERVIPYA